MLHWHGERVYSQRKTTLNYKKNLLLIVFLGYKLFSCFERSSNI